MLGVQTPSHFATHNACVSLSRRYHGDTSKSSSISNVTSTTSARIGYILRRTKKLQGIARAWRPPTPLVAFGRGCYAAAVALATAGIAGWGVQQVMPERSRTWPLLRCANAAAALVALSVDYKLLGKC